MTLPAYPNPHSVKYAGKRILAPMVKVGTLASRILALRFGADLVYSEEIIDWRFLRSKRVVNEVTQTIDYVDQSDGHIFFQTCEEEKSRVILQIGTCDPERALRVAEHVKEDISGIDINMGCPKEFSLKGGMGAALLKQPEKIKAILTCLVTHLKIPVTCKIRVLSTLEDTICLCKMIEECGVAAIAVHGRTKDERPQHSNRNHFLKEIAQYLKIPVIANGGSKEITKYEDIEKFQQDSGCSSVMVARAAEWNPSIFSKDGKDELDIVIQKFLRLAVLFDNPFTNTKYTIQNMLRELQETPQGKKFLATQTVGEICSLWDLSEYYEETQRELQSRRATIKRNLDLLNPTADLPDDPDFPDDLENSNKRRKVEDSIHVVENCPFIRGHYLDVEKLPKSILSRWARVKKSVPPVYSTESKDKRFRSIVTVDNQMFQTDVWEKNKKFAEQGAALACIKYLEIQ